MLTGVRPFAGDNLVTIGQAVVNDTFEPPSRRVAELPAAFDVVLQRALRKAPADRFPSAQAFWMAIQAAMPVPPAPTVRRGKIRLAIGVGSVLLIGIVASGWFFLAGKPTFVGTPPPQVLSVPTQLVALPCSTVRVTTDSGITSFQGVIGSGAPKDALDAIIGRQPAASVAVAVEVFPNAELSCRFVDLIRRYTGDPAARLSASGGRTTLYTGDEIRLRLTMPSFEGEVRLEDLNSDGMVDHLMEVNLGAPPRYRPGAMIGLGRGGDDLIGRVSAPYGTDLLVAIVSSEPLLTGIRLMEEPAAKFIDDLDAAMAALRRRGGHVVADALVLTTVRR